MEESILISVKKLCNIDPDNPVFDLDILMYINGAFSTLNQLGIGPLNGYEIQDATPTWSDYFGANLKYNMIKNYVVAKTKMFFDPPQSFHLWNSINQQIAEFEWRLSVLRESDTWIHTDLPPDPAVDDDPYYDWRWVRE